MFIQKFPPAFVCTKDEARALIEFASKDTTRKHLHSVCIDWRRGSAVATDGHRLARANSMQELDIEPTMIDRATFERAAKACSAKSGVIIVTPDRKLRVLDLPQSIDPAFFMGDADGATLDTFTVAQFTGEDRSDCTFPPYQQVIPDLPDYKIEKRPHGGGDLRLREATHSWGMNASYLAALQLVAKAVGKPGVEVYPPRDELDPVRFHAPGWHVVIMPMRL